MIYLKFRDWIAVAIIIYAKLMKFESNFPLVNYIFSYITKIFINFAVEKTSKREIKTLITQLKFRKL